MFSILNFLRIKTWLVIGIILAVFYFIYLVVPPFRQGVDEIRYGMMMAVPSVGPLQGSPSTKIITFDMQRDSELPPHYLYVQDAYLDRRVYPTGFGDGSLHIIFSYPGFKSIAFQTQDAKYSIPLTLDYSDAERIKREPIRAGHRYYLKNNYDLIVRAPDEKIGQHLFGYVYGMGPEYHQLGIFWRYPGGDKWYFLDKETDTYGELTCLPAGQPEKYWSCVVGLLIDDKYSSTFTYPGKELANFHNFVTGLRDLINKLEMAP